MDRRRIWGGSMSFLEWIITWLLADYICKEKEKKDGIKLGLGLENETREEYRTKTERQDLS